MRSHLFTLSPFHFFTFKSLFTFPHHPKKNITIICTIITRRNMPRG